MVRDDASFGLGAWTLTKALVGTAALAVALVAPTAGDARSTADYCKVAGHRIAKSANGKNFLCVKVYFQGRSVTFRGSYNRYGVANDVIDSEDEYGFRDYYPDDPVLTLRISNRGRVAYTDDLFALGDPDYNDADGTFSESVYASDVCSFGSGKYSWRITMEDPETPVGGQASVNRVNDLAVTCRD
ncbi:MAG TPA: hypothetical protein VGF10_11420 [Gaiella sp.]